jgi:molybdenum cofactor synthesis domain-containing protein
MGECIMPRLGIFAKVLAGGEVKVGDPVKIIWRAAVITASDSGANGAREDISGKVAAALLEQNGFYLVKQLLLPDDRALLADAMREICDQNQAQLIVTTGGTGFSMRDVTPEATRDIAQRDVPGIAEEMRRAAMTHTRRGMLSRGISVLREQTLIINLPGSPKAVEENLTAVIDQLDHGLMMLCGTSGNCAG